MTTQTKIVCFGELLLRLAAPSTQLLMQENTLEPSFCGAEANVAVGLAGLGHAARFVSAVPDNAIGAAGQAELRRHGVECACLRLPDTRLGLYYLQPGAMNRAAQITYDRAGSAFAEADPARYDWDVLLDGADWLFVSGITAALGDRALAALREGVAAAQSGGVKIAFDTNFRPSLWQGREGQAAAILRELSCEADLVFAGRRAVAMMTGESFDHADPDAGFRAAVGALFDLAPRLSHVAASRREVLSADRQNYTGLLADRDGVAASETLVLENIVDRVGTGDAFASGILHSLIKKLARDDSVAFAAACAGWAHSVKGDFMRASENDIADYVNNSGDVRR